MSIARDASVAKSDHIKTLRAMLGAATVVIVLLIVALVYAMTVKRLFVPPGFRDGGELNVETVPEVYAYEFASTLWKKMNFWETDGASDFTRNIYRFQNYFTPSCRETLKTQYYSLKKQGELNKRVRQMVDNPDYPFKDSYVRQISSGVWEVDLNMVVHESVNSTPVKNNDMLYPLRVVYFDVDRTANPWGLAIDCFSKSPELVQDNLVKGAL